jgi:hypothetical protein
MTVGRSGVALPVPVIPVGRMGQSGRSIKEDEEWGIGEEHGMDR